MRQWRLIYDQPMTGAHNMAVDEAILAAVSTGQQPPTLRLYGWQPLTLSLGYGQRVRDVDQSRLETFGWGLVRRPTGGKAILHGDELTYSVALPRHHDLAQGDVVESYRRISEALISALQILGLTPASEQQAKGNKGLGPVCFEVPSHYEITSAGKKLIGSAQVRRKDGILQHGTLPLYGDIVRICDVLQYEDPAARKSAKIAVRERAITLEGALGQRIEFEIAAEALTRGFEKTFDLTFTRAVLSAQELQTVQALYTTRYTHPDWTNKRR